MVPESSGKVKMLLTFGQAGVTIEAMVLIALAVSFMFGRGCETAQAEIVVCILISLVVFGACLGAIDARC